MLGVMLREGCKGARLTLTDHFSVPFDLEAHIHAAFDVEIGPGGALPDRGRLTTGAWHDVVLDWSAGECRCRVLVDGKPVATVPRIRQTRGVCYLRLSSPARETDPAGFAVRSVEVDVAP